MNREGMAPDGRNEEKKRRETNGDGDGNGVNGGMVGWIER